MIIIIGAGISGLSLAWHLHKYKIPYLVIEKNKEAGGYLRTLHEEGNILEVGANSLLCDAETFEMLEEFGISSQIVEANPVSKHRFIYKNGTYRPLPSSPISLLFGDFFSWSSKLAILKEPFTSSSSNNPHETLASFFRRRFGQEIVDYALSPFVAGIYAGDPEKLILAQTFPILAEFEKKYKSILKGFIKEGASNRRKSITFKKGMQELPLFLAKDLNISYNEEILGISQPNHNYLIHTNKREVEASQVVITTPAFVSSSLIENIDKPFAEALRKVEYPPIVALHSVFARKDVGFDMNGFGGLHPKKEGLFSAGMIWNSSVFEGRSKEILFTTFIGGAQSKSHVEGDLESIKKRATEELKKLYNINTEPIFQHIEKWEKSIPQYDENIVNLQNFAEKIEEKRVWICANWLGGVSVSDCMKKGKKLATKLINAYPS